MKLNKLLLSVFLVSVFSCTKEVIQPPQNISSAKKPAFTEDTEDDSVLYKNGFNADDQGWTIQGDAQGASTTPDYNTTGGSPGGFISAVDDVTGDYWYFSAPSDFLNNMKDKYGKTLKFKLKQSSTTSQATKDDLMIISGNGMDIIFKVPYNPGITWTKYTVSLKSSDWVKLSTGTAPSRTEMKKVLQNITKLWIRGEYRTGADEGGLDNVTITEKLP